MTKSTTQMAVQVARNSQRNMENMENMASDGNSRINPSLGHPWMPSAIVN
jgi:hypothetical protein